MKLTPTPVAAAVTQATDRRAFEFVKPLSVTLTIRDQDITISPLKVGEVGEFAEAVTPLIDHLPAIVADQVSGEVVLGVITQHTQDALHAVAIASRQPIAWVRELMLDELLELATVCLEVNADFFRRALPGMQSSGARLMATFSAGQTPSSS